MLVVSSDGLGDKELVIEVAGEPLKALAKDMVPGTADDLKELRMEADVVVLEHEGVWERLEVHLGVVLAPDDGTGIEDMEGALTLGGVDVRWDRGHHIKGLDGVGTKEEVGLRWRAGV